MAKYGAVLLFLASAWGTQAILKPGQRRKPLLTCGVCGLLAVSLLAQWLMPQLLLLFARDGIRIDAGEWWRMGTALFFQDGGLVGGISNIAMLLWIGSAVEQVRTRWAWLMIGMTGALAAECVALRWQPSGAGNSIFTCSLAGSLVSMPPYIAVARMGWALRAAAIALAAFLLAIRDIHGAASIVGLVAGILLRGSTLCTRDPSREAV